MADMNLKIRIQGESKQAEESVNRVNAALRGLESSSEKLNGMLAGVGVTLSAAGFAAFIKSGIDAADALNDLADRSGIAIEQLAGLEYAVKLGDTSIESFISASNKLSINISKNAEDFAKLGVTARDPVEAFKQLSDVFSAIDDPQTRAAVGAQALGKAYAEMAPLLMMGADGIQDLIDTGREHNPVTAEQARLAGELNDKLEELNNRSSKVSITLGTYAVQALNGFIQAIQFANEAVDGFDPLGWLNAGGYGASGKSGQLQYLNEQINETTASLDKLRNQGVGGQIIDAVFGSNYEENAARLEKLTAARDKLLKPADSGAAPGASTAAIDAFIKKTDTAEAASKKATASARSAASADSSRADAIKSVVENLQFEIELTGQSAEQQSILREIRSATSKATADEAAAIEALIRTKYALVEADNILADGEKLAAKQRADAADEYKRLTQLFSGENQSMYQQLDAAFQARGLGIIDDAQLARSLENISQGFDAVAGQAEQATSDMSEYGIQAARNMQSAFADFLFDPFDKGMNGMLEGFGNTVRRMAAEAASAQLMDALFGKTTKDGGHDWASGLLGAAFSGLTGTIGGGLNADINGLVANSNLFANGGIMTSAGPLSLNKYANGGIANSPQLALFGEGRMNEAYVPLPDGRSIPVTMKGSSGGVNIDKIEVNVQGGSNPEETGQRIGAAIMRTIAREEIANATRPGNRLNPNTKF